MFVERNNYVKIDLDAILSNYRAVCEKTGVPVMAVVKADAYGHGAACIAPVLQEAGVEYFAVSIRKPKGAGTSYFLLRVIQRMSVFL